MNRLSLISLSIIALSALQPAHAEISANFGIASNHVWRGKTMTDDRPAISGGIDYVHPDRHYLGLSLSNVEDEADDNNEGTRIDLYAGTHFVIGAIDLELGVIHYYFNRGDRYDTGVDTTPDTANDQSFSELLIGVSKDIYTFRMYASDDYLGSGHDSQYWQAGIDYPLKEDLSLAIYYGLVKSKAIDDSTHDLGDYMVSLTKGEYSLTWSNLDDHADAYQSDNFRLTVGWRHPISL